MRKRVAELTRLADEICAAAGISRAEVTQTVLGGPGFYDQRRDAIALAGGLAGWDRPAVLAELRASFGGTLAVENDIDAAALAEREHGHGRDFASFVFVSIGSGIGMGLVLGGQLHRGEHGAAGEIAFLPIAQGPGAAGAATSEVRRRGMLEAAGSAAAIVRAARRAGMRTRSARQVFAAAAAGDERATAIVAAEARLVAQADLRDHHGGRPGPGGAGRRDRAGTGIRGGGQARAGRDRARAAGARGSARWAQGRWWTVAWPPAPSWPGGG